MIIFILGKYYLYDYLHVFGGSSIFHYNLQLGERCSIIVKTFPGFYQELIELWCKISYQEPPDIIQIYNQCLWNNSFMLTQGKPIFNLSFINKGIFRLVTFLMNLAVLCLGNRVSLSTTWIPKISCFG